jgi:hypothetical protein
MSGNIFYVYQYLTPLGVPYYIGKGSKDRINESHAPWVATPSKEFRQYIKTGLSEIEAFDLEIELIKQYGRKIDGGILDNIKLTRWVAQAGWKHSEEAKQKISKNNTGKIRTEEHKQNYQKPKTAKHAKNIKQAVKNMWLDPDYKEKRLAMIKEQPFAHKGKPWSIARREAHIKKENKEKVST